MTVLVAACCVAVGVAQLIVPGAHHWWFSSFDSLVGTRQWWRMWTGALAHGSLVHLALNLMSVWNLRALESLGSLQVLHSHRHGAAFRAHSLPHVW